MGARSPSPPSRGGVFLLTALLHAAAIILAFPELEARLPAWLPSAILWGHFPLLLLEAYLEENGGDRKKKDHTPLWMQIDMRANFSFALALSYLSVIILKGFDLSLGPADPLGSPSAELSQRALWYGVWTIGASGLLIIGPAATLVAALRLLTSPTRRLPPLFAMLLLSLLGLGMGYGALQLLASASAKARVEALREAPGLTSDPRLAAGLAVGLVLLSVLLSASRGLRK